MALDPKLVAVLQKLESDALADLGSLLVPALFAEIQAISAGNASASAIEAAVFPAVEPAAQAALQSLLAKVPVIS